MSLNSAKCKIMHFGKNNKRRKYWVGEQELRTTEMEKDLGIMITADGKNKAQVEAAVHKILGRIRRTFKY